MKGRWLDDLVMKNFDPISAQQIQGNLISESRLLYLHGGATRPLGQHPDRRVLNSSKPMLGLDT